jgi:hypothetical protein
MRQLAPTKVLLGAFLAIHVVVVAAAAAGLLAAGLLTTGLLAAAASPLTLILLAGLIPLPSLLLSRLRRTLTFVRTLLHVLGLFGTVRHVDPPRMFYTRSTVGPAAAMRM